MPRHKPNKYAMRLSRLLHLLFSNMILIVVGGLWLSACTGSRRLPEGQYLYRGSKVKATKDSVVGDIRPLRGELEELTTFPAPNRLFLGMSTGLWLHAHTRPESWLNRKFAKTPVLYQPEAERATAQLYRNRALNNGYMHTEVSSKVKYNERRNTARITYTVRVKDPPFTIQHVTYPDTGQVLVRALAARYSSSLLKRGNRYRLDDIKAERERLAGFMRDAGYFYFSGDNMLFEADTLAGNPNMDLTLRLKPSPLEQPFTRYRIGHISVYPHQPTANLLERTDSSACVQYEGNQAPIRESLLQKALLLHCGAYYNTQNHDATLAYLNLLNAFKFVNLQFKPSNPTDSVLDVHLYLTPSKRYKTKYSVFGVFSPRLYWGAEMNAAYDWRNVFGGGELLQWTASSQLLRLNSKDATSTDLNLWTLSTGVTLKIPYLIAPRYTPAGIRAPLLQIQTGLDYSLSRFGLPKTESLARNSVSLHEITGSGGLVLKNSDRPTVTHTLNVLEASYRFTTVGPKSFQDDFENLVQTDSSLQYINFAPEVTFGPNYAIVLDNRFRTGLHRQTYYRYSAEVKGAYFLPSGLTPENLLNRNNLLGFIETDTRQYFNLNKKQVLAGKLLFNAAVPLTQNSANAFSLNDLYVVGGANSVRAFAPRQIGPGSVAPNTETNILAITNHVGNFLLESSVEFRYRWAPHWEWAGFVDAGNVWTVQPIEGAPGADFQLNRFYKELAVGTGLGIRYVFSYLVIRLDTAMPIRKPWFPEGDRWVFDEIRLSSKSWRKENLILNLSVGYPF